MPRKKSSIKPFSAAASRSKRSTTEKGTSVSGPALFVRLSGSSRRLRVTSLEDASRRYRATIDALACGASQTPGCFIEDEFGVTIARVSYNGRVWAGVSWQPGEIPVYDPFSPK